jgi:hypothetical protein
MAFPTSNTAKNSWETAGRWLLFLRPDHRKARISAADEMPPAVNFLEKQRKQRNPPVFNLSYRRVP